MADEKDQAQKAESKSKTTKVKILMRHPAHEHIPGEVVELDNKLAKSLVSQSAADDHEEAVANPTVKRDSEGNPIDLELEKHIAREKAKAAKKKSDKSE
jgi:hypothetical protein